METHSEYFNTLASEWNRMMPDEPRLKDLLMRFDIRPGDRILDIGTGTGRMARHLADLAGPAGLVVAQDFALQMILEGRQLQADKRILWVCDDCHNLATASEAFDKVLCFSAFPHFQDQCRTLEEMHRVLVPGGRLLILHLDSSETLNAFHASLDGPVSNDHLPSASSLLNIMQSNGFHSVTAMEDEKLYWVEAEKV